MRKCTELVRTRRNQQFFRKFSTRFNSKVPGAASVLPPITWTTYISGEGGDKCGGDKNFEISKIVSNLSHIYRRKISKNEENS